MGAARAWRERGVSALPDALDSGVHGVRTPWNRGFMAFRLVPARTNRDADGAEAEGGA